MVVLNNLLVIVILISLLECVAQGCLKHYFISTNVSYLFLISVICYIVVCLLLVKSYRFRGMGIVNCIWSGISILFILVIGIFFFNESINMNDIIGIILIIIGIFFIQYDGSHAKELFFYRE